MNQDIDFEILDYSEYFDSSTDKSDKLKKNQDVKFTTNFDLPFCFDSIDIKTDDDEYNNQNHKQEPLPVYFDDSFIEDYSDIDPMYSLSRSNSSFWYNDEKRRNEMVKYVLELTKIDEEDAFQESSFLTRINFFTTNVIIPATIFTFASLLTFYCQD